MPLGLQMTAKLTYNTLVTSKVVIMSSLYHTNHIEYYSHNILHIKLYKLHTFRLL